MVGILEKPELGPCKVELRPYQWEAIDAVRDEFKKRDFRDRAIRSTILNLFTSGGKTIVAGMIARRTLENNKRVLFLAHTDELIKQAANKFDFLGVDVGIEKADQHARAIWEPDAVVASVQTLKPGRLSSWPREYFDLLIIDECHHATSESYKRIINYFYKARLLGLTATIDRGDGEDLGQVFQSIAFSRDLAFAWNAPAPGPYAADIVPVQRDIGIDLRSLRTQKGDYSDADLQARITPYIEMLANLSKQDIGDRSTLAFLPQVKSAQGLATAMHYLGVRAEWTSGDDPDRQIKIKRYEQGDIQVLCSANVLIEGFDAPRTSALLMYRPTKSRNLYAQCMGRGVRLFPGKDHCVVIDPGFIAEDHDLVGPSDLCDSPNLDAGVTDIAKDLCRSTPGLSLKSAIERAKEVHREQTVMRIKVKEREIRARRVSYSMRDVYSTLGVAWRGPSASAKVNPASEGQKNWLKKLGIEDPDMSKTRASTMLDFLNHRRQEGLATHRQVNMLISLGMEPVAARAVKFADVDNAVGNLKGKKS